MIPALAQPLRAGKAMLKMLGGGSVVLIDDPPKAEPRYGYGKPPHALLLDKIQRRRELYRQWLTRFLDFCDDYRRIPAARNAAEAGAAVPCWLNSYVPGLDAVALYGLVASTRPSRYVEIGSGFSTMFARRAARDHGIDCRITSIDPQPRADVAPLCDDVHRCPVETMDPDVFRTLSSGDILFVDGTHRLLMNSDVSVLFLDVLPRLAPGVLVQFHDIWLPYDYPARWAQRYYSEQYMLAVLLLHSDDYEIVLPNRYITDDPELSGVLAPLWSRPELAAVPRHGGSFWLRRTGEASCP